MQTRIASRFQLQCYISFSSKLMVTINLHKTRRSLKRTAVDRAIINFILLCDPGSDERRTIAQIGYSMVGMVNGRTVANATFT